MAKTLSIDIMNYEKPTDEEVAYVIDFWDSVQQAVNRPGLQPLPSPDQDLLRRVACHQQWQRAMSCTHTTVTFRYAEDPACSDCDRPMKFLSDVQIADIKGA